ncbi:MAG TPA: ATP-binding protein [Accumulibacter sp.]|uniref:PAS domain-containing hybrid sensor histidine kinase/response regulator n=1 Tax=Accumulibacter sp. TaxID=2053492 RepID=UPI002BF1E46D|nr:ATP-binding protein [Accumulibacter sp.]HMV05803.1 ATP-binding protein [Accumulibacter sp.]HNB68133.1 ATP-binding protein [Accumulibacter sp.]HNK03937.1 ATP-binding protein [Accumulibacter sp.]
MKDDAELTFDHPAGTPEMTLLEVGEWLRGIGTWQWTIGSNVIVCTRGWLSIHGCRQVPSSLAELVGLVHADDSPAFTQALHAALLRSTPQALDYRIVRQDDGKTRLLGARLQIFEQADGSQRRLVGVVQDLGADAAHGRAQALGELDDARRSERELRELTESLEARVEERTRQLAEAMHKAEAASKAKSAFLANMSHEIRTPMTAILGLGELMKREGLPPRQAERLQKMNDAAQHLLGVLNAVLDLSKIEAGKLILEETTIDICAIVDSVVEMTSEAAQRKGLRLDSNCQGIPGPLLGDPTRLRQAVLNYVSNAIKFTERGGVALEVDVLEDRQESVLLRFAVRDSGIGVPTGTLQRIFEHFEQGDNSLTRQHGGSGLGLAIVKQIAQLMGGEVGAQTEPGKGSTFWFSVRLKKVMQKRSAAPPAATPSDETGERRRQASRILVVDDERANREVIAAMLTTVGLAMDCAVNGKEAVELALTTRYGLILMDLHLPQVDGLTAARLIRRKSANRHTPILALTGNVVSGVQEACLSAGMNGFIGKPFAMDVLLEEVTRWLRTPPGA